jgi:large subunit ribosomal protein L27e
LHTEAGKVVIVLQGRHAGKKAVVIKTYDDGNSDRRFSHCLIAGLARNPRRVTKAMSKEKVEKRIKTMKPFVKYVNVRHVDEADLVDPERKVEVKKNLKKVFYDRYLNQKEVTSEKKAQGSSYFFQKLRF